MRAFYGFGDSYITCFWQGNFSLSLSIYIFVYVYKHIYVQALLKMTFEESSSILLEHWNIGCPPKNPNERNESSLMYPCFRAFGGMFLERNYIRFIVHIPNEHTLIIKGTIPRVRPCSL